MYNLALETDANHMTMGYLIDNPLEVETHVLYARQGGPQVVPNLSETLRNICVSIPTRNEILEASHFWRQAGIPFPEQAWLKLAQAQRLPLDVRGVIDGEVVRPGDPIALITGPALLAASLEPILIGELMLSMQIATRYTKVITALGGDHERVFEIGMRSSSGLNDHIKKLAILKRMGLRSTSNGNAAHQLDLQLTSTMSHRYTQRFNGQDADRKAFNSAIDRMLAFRQEHHIDEALPISLLLDTRNTLDKGLPAALEIFKQRSADLQGKLDVYVRLDSGDLETQLREVITHFAAPDIVATQLNPGIVIESGMTATRIAGFEAIANDMQFDRKKLKYGIGNYLVGAIDRDWLSLVYKITEYGGQGLHDTRSRQATMKFSDDPATTSYPGRFELWEQANTVEMQRWLALTHEKPRLEALGYRNIFADLVKDGSVQTLALQSDAATQQRALSRWKTVANSYLDEEKNFYSTFEMGRNRPHLTDAMQNLLDDLRSQQLKP